MNLATLLMSVFAVSGCATFSFGVPNYSSVDPSTAVRSDSGNGFCGGLWVAPNKILTASHCVGGPMYATNGVSHTYGRELWRDEFSDLVIYEAANQNQFWAPIGNATVGETVMIVMPPGDNIQSKVLSFDLRWGGAILKWSAPFGASGSPVYNSKGELFCIVTQRVIRGYNGGTFCSLVDKVEISG